MPVDWSLPCGIAGPVVYVVQLWKVEATPRGSAPVAENLERQFQVLLLMHVNMFLGDVFAFGYDD